MKKSEILKEIKKALKEERKCTARNSMGNSESLYNHYYLIGACFTDYEEVAFEDCGLNEMSESELNKLIKLAEFSKWAFY